MGFSTVVSSSRKHDGWRIGGYQADFESGDRYSGICYGEGFRGILSDRGFHTTLTLNDKEVAKGREEVRRLKELGKAVKKKGMEPLPDYRQGFSFRTLHQWGENDRIDGQR